MKLRFASLLSSILLATVSLSHATLAGMPPAEGTYFTWDNFGASTAFTDLAPGQSSESAFSATLNSTMAGGAMTFDSGDLIYQGAVNATNYNFTIDGSVHGNLDSLSVQLKFSAPNGAGAPTISDFFSLSLADVGAADDLTFLGSETQTTGFGPFTFYIYQWTWNDLNLVDTNSFQIAGSSNFIGHVALDTVRVTDTEAVPEPSSIVLLGMGMAGMLWMRRRRGCSAAI